MNKIGKLAVGAVATALMAWGAHGPLGAGTAFISTLKGNAEAAVAETGIPGVAVTFPDNPLSRVALLSGTSDVSQRDTITKAVAAVPGVSGVRWVDATAAATPAPAAETASAADNAATDNAMANATSTPAAPVPAAVASCQSKVDAAVSGKIINFRSGSAYVPPSADALLDEVAAALKPCSGVRVEVGGHTDASGAPEINTSLSQTRAERVRDALIERGVPAAILTAKGYGPSKPANAANALDPANRRTSFTVSVGGA